MTNFEKIKSMSVEEIADADFSNCYMCSRFKDYGECYYGACRNGKIEWLNQEVGE